MLKDILRKFEQLPEEKKRFLSSPMVLSSLEEIEKKYKIKLALILMEIVVDKNKSDNLANFLENRLALKKNNAFQIAQELEELILREFNVINDFSENKKDRTEPAIKNTEIKKDQDIEIENSKQDEIKKIENEIKELEPIFVKSVDWEEEAKKIISELDIDFKNDLLKNRFKNIIISAIKGVRSQIDFKDILRRRENEAGMEFSGEVVNKILSVVKKRKQEIENGDGLEKQDKKEFLEKSVLSEQIILPEEKDKTVLQEIPESEKIIMEENKNTDDFEIKNKEQKILSPPPPVIVKQDKAKNEFKKEEQNTEQVLNNVVAQIQHKKIESKKENDQKNQSFRSFLFNKQHTKDVEPKILEKEKAEKAVKKDLENKKSKLVGPIDEIADLTIEDFRSWSENPYEAIKNIKKKIDVLMRESLEKGSSGMKAWKKSEINRIYLDILHSALIKRKEVNEIIQEMKNERKQTLELDEFEAIEQLNRELRG